MKKAFYVMMGFIVALSLCLGLMLTVDKTEILTLDRLVIDGNLTVNADEVYVRNTVVNGGLTVDKKEILKDDYTIYWSGMVEFDRKIEVEPDDIAAQWGTETTNRIYRYNGDTFYFAYSE